MAGIQLHRTGRDGDEHLDFALAARGLDLLPRHHQWQLRVFDRRRQRDALIQLARRLRFLVSADEVIIFAVLHIRVFARHLHLEPPPSSTRVVASVEAQQVVVAGLALRIAEPHRGVVLVVEERAPGTRGDPFHRLSGCGG